MLTRVHARQDGVDAAVLAAQAQQQHAAGVGMAAQVRQHLPGVVLVAAHLRAAVGMAEGVHAVHAGQRRALQPPGQRGGHVVYAAHGGHDPQLVADAHAAVLPAIAREADGFGGLRRGVGRRPGICLFPAQERAQVVHVHVPAGGNGTGGRADGKAVLHHGLARGDVPQRHLVAHGHVIGQRDGGARHLGGMARRQWPERHGHGVLGMDA